MVVREILDELTGLERGFSQAIRLLPEASKREQIQRILEGGLRRCTKTKARIRACCRPAPVAGRYLPKIDVRKAA